MAERHIILSVDEADAVRGATADGAALEPFALADGATFVLPEAVLADPAHAARHAALAGLPLRELAPQEWPSPPSRG